MNMFSTFNIPSVLIGLVVTIIIFLVIREILCWYWKINELVDTQREMRDLLQQIEINTNKGRSQFVKSDLKVGDKVRLTEEKLEQMRKNNSVKPSQTFGHITAIDGNSANVQLGTEIGRVELENLQRQG